MDLEYFLLFENGWIPNNPFLPVIVYRELFDGNADLLAIRFSDMFERNGWPVRWRSGVEEEQHYHSSAHEVLGVVAGSATLLIGGENGRPVALGPGDALVLPVGTGHCCIAASADFEVVGGYPEGQHLDLCRELATDGTKARMRGLLVPKCDPAEGETGILTRLW